MSAADVRRLCEQIVAGDITPGTVALALASLTDEQLVEEMEHRVVIRGEQEEQQRRDDVNALRQALDAFKQWRAETGKASYFCRGGWAGDQLAGLLKRLEVKP